METPCQGCGSEAGTLDQAHGFAFCPLFLDLKAPATSDQSFRRKRVPSKEAEKDDDEVLQLLMAQKHVVHEFVESAKVAQMSVAFITSLCVSKGIESEQNAMEPQAGRMKDNCEICMKLLRSG